MELNPIWLADASFLLNAALLAVICEAWCQHLRKEFGLGAAVGLAMLALFGVITLTVVTRGVVHDALVAQAATEQVESAESIDQTPPSTSALPSDLIDYHIY